MTNEAKLAVLAKVGAALNGARVSWAVGASLMLYLRRMTDTFHDIDLVTTIADADAVCAVLSRLGALQPANPSALYKTKRFLEFIVDGVELDVMAGYAITRYGVDYDRAFDPASVDAHATVGGVTIPLQAVAVWRENYRLMGRADKVALIDGQGVRAPASPKG